MEVPGKRSHLSVSCDGSNEDDEDFYCDPCENEGERQPAKGFCVDCQEYLCASCFTIHKRPAVWRHHVLLDKDAMPKTKTKEQLNYECTEPCVEHSTKIIEYYCQTHHQLGCPVCITGNHRTCNDVDYIPHIAERYKDSSEINEIFDSLESLQEETDEHTETANNDKLKLAVYEKNAKAHVLQLRDEFNSICDRLLEDIDTVKSSDESKIKNSIAKYEEISKKIKTRTAVMDKKRSEMKVSQLFTEAKLSKLSADELAKEVTLARENATIRHYEMAFNVEELRDGLKLNFHDNQIENVISEFECHSPSEYTNKLARNSTMTEAEAGDESNQPANAAGQSKKSNKRNVKASNMEGKVEREYPPDLHHSDVWSPLNTKGMKKYDRDFLLQFRNCACALRKPNHLPDIPDIILDKSIGDSSNENPSDFKPKYAWTAAAAKRPPSSQGKGTQQSAKPKEKKHILSIIDPNIGKDVTEEIVKTIPGSTEVTRSSDSGSRTMLGWNAEEPQGQSGESNAIAAQFAALVAAKLYHPPDVGSPPSHTLPPPQQQYRCMRYMYMYFGKYQFYQPSQQNMFASPSLPYPIRYPHPGTSQIIPPPQPKMFNADMREIRSTKFSSGISYSHPGPAQVPPNQQFTPYPGYSNQPRCMDIQTANYQLQLKGKMMHTNPTAKKPILNMIDPSCGRDVTEELLRGPESQDFISRISSAEISKIGAKLNDLIVKNKEENEAVMMWIDRNVDFMARKQHRFIRALMAVICNSAIKGNKGLVRFEPKEISTRSDILKWYISKDSNLELQALYAVQALISQLGHPKGVLRAIFDTFYDEDLIAEDVLWQWQRSKDEPVGKEECLKQTVPFFTWLKEAEDDYM